MDGGVADVAVGDVLRVDVFRWIVPGGLVLLGQIVAAGVRVGAEVDALVVLVFEAIPGGRAEEACAGPVAFMGVHVPTVDVVRPAPQVRDDHVGRQEVVAPSVLAFRLVAALEQVVGACSR